MTLEKSSRIQVSKAEYLAIKGGTLPERLEAMGFSLEDLQAKLMADEYEIVD